MQRWRFQWVKELPCILFNVLACGLILKNRRDYIFMHIQKCYLVPVEMPESTCWRCTHLDCSCEHKQIFKAVLLLPPTPYKGSLSSAYSLLHSSSSFTEISFLCQCGTKIHFKKITDVIKFKIISPPDNATCSLFTLTCGNKGEDSWLLYFCESANAWNTAKLMSTSCPCLLPRSKPKLCFRKANTRVRVISEPGTDGISAGRTAAQQLESQCCFGLHCPSRCSQTQLRHIEPVGDLELVLSIMLSTRIT